MVLSPRRGTQFVVVNCQPTNRSQARDRKRDPVNSLSSTPSEPPAKASPPARNYSAKTLKILFALSGNRCAHPKCNEPVIANATLDSTDLVVGQISHIYAHSDKGPRGKPGMTEKERNQADNLMLFCPTHHVIVDGQHETYTAPILLGWKQHHERRYRDNLSARLTDIGYAELEVAARAACTGSGRQRRLWKYPSGRENREEQTRRDIGCTSDLGRGKVKRGRACAARCRTAGCRIS